MMQVKLVPESQVTCRMPEVEVLPEVEGLQPLGHHGSDFQ